MLVITALIILLFTNVRCAKLIPDDRNGIVQLFEWKFSDIAKECERFLGPYKYAGIQISPIIENLIVNGRPWHERYQPISYDIFTRSGNESEFRDMVQRCNAANVRVIVDAVFNHMTASVPNARGVGGSTADSYNKNYPGVPYSYDEFHSTCGIQNYQNADEVRNCELLGMHDLNQGLESVREKIVNLMNHMIDIGVAGFRLDAGKHMWPEDLRIIISRLKPVNIPGVDFNTRPLVYLEIIDLGGEAIKATEYTDFASVTDFKFGNELGRAFKGNNMLKWLRNFGVQWGLLNSSKSVVFIDNHDNQRDNNGNILTYKQSKQYKMATAFMLSWPHGLPRIMSSYGFDNRDQGPPHYPDDSIMDVGINPDLTCYNGWICEHRWRQIYNMVAFKNNVKDAPVTNFWDNGSNQIAFCRGSGFIAFNGDPYDLNATLKTCLPPGIYCDVISGLVENNSCSGKTVVVNEDGTANISLRSNEEDGVIAIHTGVKIR